MAKKIFSFRRGYGFLSNFYMASFIIAEKKWRSVEHYYQAHKTKKKKLRKEIRKCENFIQAKRLGKKLKLRKDWDDVKDKIMYKTVKAKFFQNSDLAKKLIDTGNAKLIEGNRWGDEYWGKCRADGKWVGKNKLGKILMQVRKELQNR